MNKLSIDDVNFSNKKVLMRVDFNVPLNDKLEVTDSKRIEAALPSIRKILNDGGKLILMSHLGRPKGAIKNELSLKPVAKKLESLLNQQVYFVQECIGEKVKKLVNSLKEGEILLLENLRFHKEEEKNDPDFAKALAALADIYVNDAFGTAHRAHASTAGITNYIEKSVSGYLLQKELDYLGKAIINPQRPFTAILGGAKISGKIDVIKNLISKVDTLMIGGGMIFTFYKAMGYEIGKSLVEEEKINLAKEILEIVKDKNVNFYLPVDVVVSEEFDNEAHFENVEADKIPTNMIGMDIGQKTIDLFSKIIIESKTVVWNGPMGVFELSNFANGTFAIANALAKATKNGATTIVGGGDSAAAVKMAGVGDLVSHVSTGGGASLEFLEGKELPGVNALADKWFLKWNTPLIAD